MAKIQLRGIKIDSSSIVAAYLITNEELITQKEGLLVALETLSPLSSGSDDALKILNFRKASLLNTIANLRKNNHCRIAVVHGNSFKVSYSRNFDDIEVANQLLKTFQSFIQKT